MDPLKEIVDRHLFRASTEDQNSTVVIEAILYDYFKLLTSQGVNVPLTVKKYFLEDLREEIKEIIIKRTHATVPMEAPAPVQKYVPTRKLT